MNIEAFVLVGGRSSRLGRNKATVELGGMPLGLRAVNVIREALEPARVTFVAANPTQFGNEAFLADTPFIFDLIEGFGPLGGIHTALSYAQTPWVFVLACDYPFVSSDLVKLLASRVSDEFGVVAPEQPDGRLQPLCAFYKTATARPVIDEIINLPRVLPPLQEIVSKLSPRILAYEEYSHFSNANDLFINLNTADDLEKILQRENDLRKQPLHIS
ncbi:MAG TPA: molybdenum cofactor guanylyltransferase [Pyrinomonadaceae bacterium]|nr:molybdenum cofactor guanylyltransferase [Pyrinomonadaceae bacterium]